MFNSIDLLHSLVVWAQVLMNINDFIFKLWDITPSYTVSIWVILDCQTQMKRHL